MKVHEYFHRWLEIQISGTLDICMLSKSKFGLDIIYPLTEFIQCKTIYRNRLKNSKLEDTWVIHETTSHTNIQYDRFNSTREIVKSVRSNKQDKIKNKLTSQGFIVSFLWENARKQTSKLWPAVQSRMPQTNIFNSIQYGGGIMAPYSLPQYLQNDLS